MLLLIASLIGLVVVLTIVVIVIGERNPRMAHLRAPILRFLTRTAANGVPVIHVAAIGFFLWLFELNCLHLVRSTTHRLIIRVSYTFPFLAMARIFFSNPGKITRYNHDKIIDLFPYDRILFMPHKECRTCLFEKPARSGHCSICDGCIALRDHHCVWVNNCIGFNNTRWFLLFLVVHIYFLGYGFILTSWMLWDAVASQWGLVNRHVWSPVFWWELSWRVIELGMTYRIAFCCWVLCSFICTVAVVFSLHQIRFIYQGITANEGEKWGDVEALLYEGRLYVYKNPRGQILLERLDDGQWNRRLTADEERWVKTSGATLEVARSWDDLDNIYDKGFWNNLKLLLFPPDVFI